MGEDLLAAHRKTDCETDSCSLMGRKKQTNKQKKNISKGNNRIQSTAAQRGEAHTSLTSNTWE